MAHHVCFCALCVCYLLNILHGWMKGLVWIFLFRSCRVVSWLLMSVRLFKEIFLGIK